MRCDDIKENLVSLLYDEEGTVPVNQGLRDHLHTCAACRQELEELRQTRKHLQEWKDESPLRSISIARQELVSNRRNNWKYLRYAAVAAMALLCIMALANMELTIDRSGFSIRTNLFRRDLKEREFYTKSEVRDLMKRALDDSEVRINEVNYLMLQKMLDTMERDRWSDLRLVRGSAVPNGNRN